MDVPCQQSLGGVTTYDASLGAHYSGILYGSRRDILPSSATKPVPKDQS